MRLFPHPSHGSVTQSVTAQWRAQPSDAEVLLDVEWCIDDPAALIHWPPKSGVEFAERLWHSTCGELFLATRDGAYVECHYSPSGHYAHYLLTTTRGPLQRLEWPVPQVHVTRTPTTTQWRIGQRLPNLGFTARGAVTLVLKLNDQSTLYWAAHHPAVQPDFHDQSGWIDLWSP